MKDKKPEDMYVMPGANPEAVAADLERRRSSAASPQERGLRRKRTRRDARTAAIREEL